MLLLDNKVMDLHYMQGFATVLVQPGTCALYCGRHVNRTSRCTKSAFPLHSDPASDRYADPEIFFPFQICVADPVGAASWSSPLD